jgi:adenylate cyclase
MERKLSAILYADVAGYSRLVGSDEEGTHRVFRVHFDTLTAIIKNHGGRVVHTAGDAVLAEFASVVTALECAVAAQRDLGKRNQEFPDNRKLRFRIGVNLGDVIVDGEEIYGNGVNVAARLETLADAGGICISRQVLDEVRGKVDVGFEYLGPQRVKNIEKPVNGYRVLLDPADADKVIGERKWTMRWRWAAIAGAVAVIIVTGALTFWLRPWTPDFEPASIERMAFPLPAKPSIAVLPLTNLSGDAEQDYLADGMTESMINALSKVPNLFVIAHNSTFVYKGKPVKVQQVAEELGVRYVLHGSVQRSADRVRITAQLIDAIAGNYLWSERYDRNVKDIFALQDEITLNVVKELQVVLTEGEMARVHYHGTDRLEAVLLAAQSREYIRRFTKEDNLRGRELAEKAIALDPKFAEPYARLGWTHYLDAQAGWSASPIESFNRALALAQKALTLDATHPDSYALLGLLHLLLKEHDEAIVFAEKAIALSPNDSSNLAGLAFILNYAGEPEKAIPLLDNAMRLSPYYPDWYLGELGRAYILTAQYQEAIAALAQRLRRNPNSGEAQVLLAAAYGASNRNEEARATLAQFLKPRPGYTLGRYAQGEFYKNPEDLKRVLNGLRNAGLTD